MIDKSILEWFIPALKEQTTIKGDVPGHEFHGNQYADGSGGGGGESSSDGGGGGEGDSGGDDRETGIYYSRGEDLGDVQFGKAGTYNGHKEITVERLNKKGMFESPSAKVTIVQHSKDDANKYALYVGSKRGHLAGMVEGGLKVAKTSAASILNRVESVDISGNYRIRSTDGKIISISGAK